MKNGRIDNNQPDIVKVLRQAGASVAVTSNAGKGFPDIVVGYLGVNLLMEIKDGEKPPSQRKLTPDEQKFKDNWLGTYIVVNSVNDALSALEIIKRSIPPTAQRGEYNH